MPSSCDAEAIPASGSSGASSDQEHRDDRPEGLERLLGGGVVLEVADELEVLALGDGLVVDGACEATNGATRYARSQGPSAAVESSNRRKNLLDFAGSSEPQLPLGVVRSRTLLAGLRRTPDPVPSIGQERGESDARSGVGLLRGLDARLSRSNDDFAPGAAFEVAQAQQETLSRGESGDRGQDLLPLVSTPDVTGGARPRVAGAAVPDGGRQGLGSHGVGARFAPELVLDDARQPGDEGSFAAVLESLEIAQGVTERGLSHVQGLQSSSQSCSQSATDDSEDAFLHAREERASGLLVAALGRLHEPLRLASSHLD